MGKIALACLMALSLVGCATYTPPKAVQSIPPEAKTVAVLSSVPDRFFMEATGMTIFENSLDSVDVTDWHMADLVYQTAYDTLSPRYTVVRATSDFVLDDPESRLDKATHSTRFETIVQQHVHVDQPVDLYVVVAPGAVAEIYTGMPNIYKYIGISKTRALLTTLDPMLHTFLLVTVFDGKTFKTLGYSPLMVSPETSKYLVSSGDVQGMPMQRMTAFQWQNNWGDLSDSQRDMIEQSVKSLLTKSVSYTLNLMLPGNPN